MRLKGAEIIESPPDMPFAPYRSSLYSQKELRAEDPSILHFPPLLSLIPRFFFFFLGDRSPSVYSFLKSKKLKTSEENLGSPLKRLHFGIKSIDLIFHPCKILLCGGRRFDPLFTLSLLLSPDPFFLYLFKIKSMTYFWYIFVFSGTRGDHRHLDYIHDGNA